MWGRSVGSTGVHVGRLRGRGSVEGGPVGKAAGRIQTVPTSAHSIGIVVHLSSRSRTVVGLVAHRLGQMGKKDCPAALAGQAVSGLVGELAVAGISRGIGKKRLGTVKEGGGNKKERDGAVNVRAETLMTGKLTVTVSGMMIGSTIIQGIH